MKTTFGGMHTIFVERMRRISLRVVSLHLPSHDERAPLILDLIAKNSR